MRIGRWQIRLAQSPYHRLKALQQANRNQRDMIEAQARVSQQLKNERRELEDVLGSIWLYIDWRYVTRQLTTRQKELFADAVDAWDVRLTKDSGEGYEGPVADRWWRDPQGEWRKWM